MNETLDKLFEEYRYTAQDKNDIMRIIAPIIAHEEFQRRMTDEFPHHGEITLGNHILSDTLLTYKMLQHPKYRKLKIDKNTASLIALFHDLYTLSWQNNPENTEKHKYNAHAFRHPLEAIINSITWYPEYFEENNQATKIIDGVIHYMFPLPVKRFDKTPMELKNEALWENIPKELKRIIITSSNRGLLIKHFSLCPSRFIEGRIMSAADKKVSINNYLTDYKENGISGTIALLTGENENLKGKTYVKKK